jgi:hypothetical protein
MLCQCARQNFALADHVDSIDVLTRGDPNVLLAPIESTYDASCGSPPAPPNAATLSAGDSHIDHIAAQAR